MPAAVRARWRRPRALPTLRAVMTRPTARALLALVASVGVAAGCSAPEALSECNPADGLTPICGFLNPEDLATLPGGAWIAVSQLGGQGVPGSLLAFRNSDGSRRVLYPGGEYDLSSEQPAAGWGDAACPGPPDVGVFMPHGIDVARAQRQPPRLAVVNHGGREAIELFEVGYARGGPALGWRGCILLPDDVMANDVALLADGSLMATDMLAPLDDFEGAADVARMFVGSDTGEVLAWRADVGWVAVPGSEAVTPNGIAVSADGFDLYFSEWSAGRLVRIRLSESGPGRRTSIELPHLPDNLSWTRDGHLLVTGQEGPLGDVLGCAQIESGTCAVGFSVIRIEPATLETELLLAHPGTAMGAASSSLQVGDELLIGTFAGDRIARASYSQ
jgi:hypothetical protein